MLHLPATIILSLCGKREIQLKADVSSGRVPSSVMSPAWRNMSAGVMKDVGSSLCVSEVQASVRVLGGNVRSAMASGIGMRRLLRW